jgi:hypothetical protein
MRVRITKKIQQQKIQNKKNTIKIMSVKIAINK